jgi:2'-5' RNA ligase
MSKRQHESRTGFHQPENYDRTHEGTGWNFWQGANDWEHAPTWMWVVFPGDSENKRVWVEVNYEGHGNPDDGEVRYDGPEAKEAKAWGEKAIKTWLRVAKRLHSEKDENGCTRQWIDAFKAALQDDEVKAFIKQSGTDRTNWEPMKESKAIVAALLEDVEVERLTDEIAANGYVVVATGEAGQKLYCVANRFRFSSYAKDAQVFATPEGAKEAMQHANALYKYRNTRIEVWLGEGEEDPKDFIGRQNMQRGFTVQVGVVNPLRRRKLTWYYSTHEGELVKELQVLSRARASYLMRRFKAKYDPKRIKLGQAYHPGDPNDAMFENEADDFLARLDQRIEYGYVVMAQTAGGACYWYDRIHHTGPGGWGQWVKTVEEATTWHNVADAIHALNAIKSESTTPDSISLISRAPTLESEADDFLQRMDSKAKDRLCFIAWGKDAHRYYVRYTPREKNWWMKSSLVVLPEHATKFPFAKAVELLSRLRFRKHGRDDEDQSGFEIVPVDVEAENIAAYRRRCQGLPESLTEAVYNRSSCQINAPEDIADFLIQWGMLNIPDEKLYIEPDGGCGREDEPHVTVRYGLDFPVAPEEFHRLITTWKAFPIRLAGVSLFKNDKFDVVKLDVISDDLLRLNAEIRKQFPSQQPDKFPDYHPHLTIAYVQPGTCDALEGADPFKASPDVVPEFEADRLRFSGAGDTETGDRNIQFIPFDKTQSTEQRRAEEIVAEALEDEVEDVLDRARFRYYQIEKKALTREWLAAGANRPGASIRFTPEMGHAGIYTHAQAVQLLQCIPEPDQSKCRLVPAASREIELGESSDEADEFLQRFGRFVIAMIAPQGYHASPVYLEPDGTYHYTVGNAKVFMTRNEADEELARQRPLVDEEYTLKVVTLQSAQAVKAFGPVSRDFGESLAESEAFDAEAYVKDMPVHFLVTFEPGYQAAMYYTGDSNRMWSEKKEDGKKYATREEAWEHAKRLSARYKGAVHAIHVRQQLGESVEDDVTDFLDRQGFLIRHNVFAGQWTYWCDAMGGWGPSEMATRFPSLEAAEQKVRELSRHRHLLGISPVAVSSLQAESVNPFGALNFPVDASEVLTKIRTRRNHRGAPTWF